MNKPKIIILADLGSLKITCEGFKQLVSSLEEKFEIVTCKFYSYVAKRNRDYNEYIAANAFETALPSASRRRNRLDSRQIIDATDIAALGKVDAIGFITGEGDMLPVVNMLKSKGIDAYDIDVEEGDFTYAYTGFIPVPLSALREGYTAPATKKAAKKKAAKKVKQPVRPENPYVAEAKKVLGGDDILSRYRR